MSFWDKLFGKKPEESSKEESPPESSTLTDFVRGLQHAVNRAQQVGEHHFIGIFDRFLEEDIEELPDGKKRVKYYPKMVTFKMKGDELHVPLITLVPPASLTLNKMQVKMAMRVDKTGVKKALPKEHHHRDGTTRSSFQVSMAPLKSTGDGGGGQNRDMNAMEVTMEFVAGDPPEGVSRIFEAYTNSITPSQRGDPPPGETSLKDGTPEHLGTPSPDPPPEEE